MSLGALMLQEYTSGVYQPCIQLLDPNIRLIQNSLVISDSPFASSELLTLELLFPPNGTPMNITILDDTILYITYIYKLPSTSPIADQFPIDTRINIYVVAIDNEYS